IVLSGEPSESIELEYDFALPKPVAGGAEVRRRGFEVPQIWPEQATRIDAKGRVWCEPGSIPVLADANLANAIWKDRGVETGPGRPSLPALVLYGSGARLPLFLDLQETPAPRPVELFIDRALIRAAIDEEGQHYAARFVVCKFNAKQLSIELPAPVQGTLQNIYLDGRRLPYQAEGNVLKVKVDPEAAGQPALLDLEYHVPRALLARDTFWQTHFHPPTFKGLVSIKRVGWQIGLPAGQTPLVAGSDTVLDFRWGLRNGVLTPEPVVSGGWESWPGAADLPPADSASFWRNTLGPARVFHLPWQGWFLICSGTLLRIGLVLCFSALPRLVLWLVLGALVLGALASRFFWPSLFPLVLYGVQPGALLLLLMLGAQWLVQERYRRQLVFMPGFKRAKPGSSLVRTGSSNRPRAPSTVDAPPSGVTGEAASPSGS